MSTLTIYIHPIQSAIPFFRQDMIEGLPSARFSLRAGKPSVLAYVNMSHAEAAADQYACPG